MQKLAKTVLVTGATGFIGQHVVDYLLSTNIRVIATARTKPTIEQVSWLSDVLFIPFDIATSQNGTDLYTYFNKPDAVIHLAWQGLPDYRSQAHIDTYWLQHYHFLTNLLINGLPNLTVTGTCLEYGLQSGCLLESIPTQPSTAYGLAKDTLRQALNLFIADHPASLKWVRLFYMYGRGQNSKSLLAQLEAAASRNETAFNMSAGEQLRDYLPVTRVAAYIAELAHLQGIVETINCCSGQPVSVRVLVERFMQKNNCQLTLNLGYYPYPDYEPMAFWGNNKKLLTLLNQ